MKPISKLASCDYKGRRRNQPSYGHVGRGSKSPIDDEAEILRDLVDNEEKNCPCVDDDHLKTRSGKCHVSPLVGRFSGNWSPHPRETCLKYTSGNNLKRYERESGHYSYQKDRLPVEKDYLTRKEWEHKVREVRKDELDWIAKLRSTCVYKHPSIKPAMGVLGIHAQTNKTLTSFNDIVLDTYDKLCDPKKAINTHLKFLHSIGYSDEKLLEKVKNRALKLWDEGKISQKWGIAKKCVDTGSIIGFLPLEYVIHPFFYYKRLQETTKRKDVNKNEDVQVRLFEVSHPKITSGDTVRVWYAGCQHHLSCEYISNSTKLRYSFGFIMDDNCEKEIKDLEELILRDTTGTNDRVAMQIRLDKIRRLCKITSGMPGLMLAQDYLFTDCFKAYLAQNTHTRCNEDGVHDDFQKEPYGFHAYELSHGSFGDSANMSPLGVSYRLKGPPPPKDFKLMAEFEINEINKHRFIAFCNDFLHKMIVDSKSPTLFPFAGINNRKLKHVNDENRFYYDDFSFTSGSGCTDPFSPSEAATEVVLERFTDAISMVTDTKFTANIYTFAYLLKPTDMTDEAFYNIAQSPTYRVDEWVKLSLKGQYEFIKTDPQLNGDVYHDKKKNVLGDIQKKTQTQRQTRLIKDAKEMVSFLNDYPLNCTRLLQQIFLFDLSCVWNKTFGVNHLGSHVTRFPENCHNHTDNENTPFYLQDESAFS